MLLRQLLRLLFTLLAIPGNMSSYYSTNTNQNYNYYSNQNQGSRTGYYDQYGSNLQYTNCRDAEIKVTKLQVLCDSPYTFYYGNGAHRNSPYCDYGDRVTTSVQFTVLDDIRDVADIYFTFALYDPHANFLFGAEPQYLCQNYVGSDCTYAGTYSFEMKSRLTYPDANLTKFIPTVQMSFSTAADYGYNLGAVNIQCKSKNANDWFQAPVQSPLKSFMIQYGVLTGTVIGIVFMTTFVWVRAIRLRRPQAFDLMD